MMELKEKISKLAEENFIEIREIRRHLHKHPELSFKENKTSQFIQQLLKDEGFDFKMYVNTGIAGVIEGTDPNGKTIVLRADIDALPVQERGNHDFKSINEGIMHACGHDVHTSSMFGALKILWQLKDYWKGRVMFLFQPGEEVLPGGAKLMMEEGVFDKINPDLIIGQHVQPDIESGKVGFKPGMYMASTDELYLTVKGKGGHAAMPHQLIDPVVMASNIIISLQQITSRFANAAIPTVLSFGKINGGHVNNVIPDEVKLAGTFRTMNEEWRTKAHQLIRSIASSVAKGFGGDCEIEIQRGYPFLVNHEEMTIRSKEYAVEFLNEDNVLDLDIRMTAEDFAYFSQKFPSVFYRLGVKAPDNHDPAPLHSGNFFADERALVTGMSTMAYLAINHLNS